MANCFVCGDLIDDGTDSCVLLCLECIENHRSENHNRIDDDCVRCAVLACDSGDPHHFHPRGCPSCEQKPLADNGWQ